MIIDPEDEEDDAYGDFVEDGGSITPILED